MATQKRNEIVYGVIILLAVLVFTGSLFAHGNEKHVLGVVKAVGADSVTVETTSHQSQTVQITAQTKFIKSGAPSSLSDLSATSLTVKSNSLRATKSIALDAASARPGATATWAPTNPMRSEGFSAFNASATRTSDANDGVLVCRTARS